MRKLTLVLSVLNLLFFIVPFMMILIFEKNSDNNPITRGMIVFYYSVQYIWYIIPAIFYLTTYFKGYKKQAYEFFMFLVNIFALLLLFPQFKEEVFR